VPESVKRDVRAFHRAPTPFETVFSLLNHARLSERVLCDEIARSEIAGIAGRVAQLIASVPGQRSFFLSPGFSSAPKGSSAPLIEGKLYWSESGEFREAASLRFHYLPGKTARLSLDLPAFSQAQHLRIDPADRAGLVRVNGVIVRSLISLEPIWAATEGTALAKLQIGGTALQLPSDVETILVSTGEDPWIVLPPLPRTIIDPVRIEIDLRFEDAEAALAHAATKILALTDKLRQDSDAANRGRRPKKKVEDSGTTLRRRAQKQRSPAARQETSVSPRNPAR
jgi:hypothetical protein